MSFLDKFKFGKKKEKKEEVEEIIVEEKGVIEKGRRTVKDLIAPPSLDRSNPNHLVVGNKYVRSYVMNGYPPNVDVGWLTDLYDYDGDMDVALYLDPADKRVAAEELTKKITQYEAQLYTEKESGKITNIGKLETTIRALYNQRSGIERDQENLFYAQIYLNLYSDSENELEKRHDMLINKLKGRNISLLPSYLEQDQMYKNALPYGKVYTNERFRSLNTGAVSDCFPFYNSEISHESGVFMGVNMDAATPVIIDFYDRSKLNNSNFTVFGTSGSGKSYMVSVLTIRSSFQGIKTVIIDPDGEYVRLSREMGGTHLSISRNSETRINPFDLEEEDETDDYGRPTGRKVVLVKDKIADLVSLIGVMNGGFTREQESLTSVVLDEVYKDFGFTEDPKSLYHTEAVLDEESGEFYHHGEKKRMPTLSDFHDKLTQKAQETNNRDLMRLSNSLLMFRKEGTYGLFDGQTSANVDFKNSPIITFDISELEEGVLRPVGMYISLTWTWEKFIKKNPEIKKRVIVDEAWMLVNENMAGYEYTANFLDVMARRVRKRNGGLVVASQNFIEFYKTEQGKAVLTNAAVNIFLKQASVDIDAVQEVFKLSDGERDFLHSSDRGEALIKIGEESSRMYVLSFPHEHFLITGDYK